MNLRQFMTKQKIISLIFILCLVAFCYIAARIGMRRINEPVTPLSPVNIEAMFYVEMPDSGKTVCIGDGLINTSEEKSGQLTVGKTIVTAPDYDALWGNNYHIVWNSIRHGEDGIRVYGNVASGPKPDNSAMANVFANVADMKAATPAIGDTLKTRGYYTEDDGGASEYVISASPIKGVLDSIQLNNGLYANLQISDVLNVKQLGAVGDGVADDTDILKKAIKVKIPTIEFAPGTYKCTSHLIINANNLTINGNNSSIISANDFSASYREWFITFSGSDINVRDLKVVATENVWPKYKSQVGVRDITNFTMYNCQLIVPDTVTKDSANNRLEYSNLDVYTNWHNVNIDHCLFENYSGVYAGVNAEFRDIKGVGCSDATFTNNECHHNTRDENLTVFTLADKNTINNVVISDNKFYQYPCPSYTRYVGMALGYNDEHGYGANNVTFTNNYYDGYADFNLVKIGNSANVNVSNNEIVCHVEDGTSTLSIFKGTSNDTNVAIQNNTVTISNDGKNALKTLASGKMTLTENNVSTDLKFRNTIFESNSVDNNNTVITNY